MHVLAVRTNGEWRAGGIFRLQNKIQHYKWGSRTAIAELLNRPGASERPEAELWLGAHPQGCSSIDDQGVWIGLEQYIAGNPAGVLGQETSRRFAGRLPFLLKVLAAAEPLSIQAHPNQGQAITGFAREEGQGVPLNSPGRNYRDEHHKPELLVALTPFTALKGFRPITAIIQHVRRYCLQSLGSEIQELAANPQQSGLRKFFITLLGLSADQRDAAIGEALSAIRQGRDHSLEALWLEGLYRFYPRDIGVLAPLLLNLIVLAPGQGLFLPAGELHAYLQGVGIEIMANSDNVIRGGLTPKHIDIKELAEILSFEAREVSILTPAAGEPGEMVYETPAAEFMLSIIQLAHQHHSFRLSSAEILLCLAGEALLNDNSGALRLRKGDSVFIPAFTGEYQLRGDCRIIRARTPN